MDQQVDHAHEGGDDDDVAGDTHLVGDDVFQRRDEHVGHQQHEGRGRAHAQGVGHRGGDGERRTAAQHQNQGGVFFEETFGQYA